MDLTQRRHRFAPPKSTGQKLLLSERDIQVFWTIYKHGGPIGTRNLLRSVGGERTWFSHRLTQLYNETNNRIGSTFLSKPSKQRLAENARYQDVVYEITLAAEQVLQSRGLWFEPFVGSGAQFLHDYMGTHISFSAELACRAVGAKFVSKPEIMHGRPLKFPMPDGYEWEGHELTTAYEPDKLFGIENDGKLRYYFLEADRNKEPLRRGGTTLEKVAASKNPFGSSSIFRKFVQLQKAIPVAREIFGRPVMCLIVTNDMLQFNGIIELAKEFKVNNTILVKCIPEFYDDDHVVLPPIEDILFGWTMAKDGSPFDLLQLQKEYNTQEVASAV